MAKQVRIGRVPAWYHEVDLDEYFVDMSSPWMHVREGRWALVGGPMSIQYVQLSGYPENERPPLWVREFDEEHTAVQSRERMKVIVHYLDHGFAISDMLFERVYPE